MQFLSTESCGATRERNRIRHGQSAEDARYDRDTKPAKELPSSPTPVGPYYKAQNNPVV